MLRATVHSVTDRQSETDGQTDGQQYNANSRSYCVAVRLAKNHMTWLVFLACD